jgi:hypothetical protein
MAFFLWCSAMTILGRKIGWEFSRQVLYKAGRFECVIYCIVWGVLTALGLHGLIVAWHPGVFLEIYGYGAGAYISAPSYGLLNERTLPETVRGHHLLIQSLPDATYVIASVILAFGIVK